MTIRFVSTIVAGAALWAASPALAQSNSAPARAAPLPAATAIYRSVTENDLRLLVLAEGYTVDKMHPYEAPSVRGKTKDGTLFVLIGTACDKGVVKGCQGIMMQVRYDADSAVTVQGILDANMAQAAVSTWWDKTDKTVGFTRYVVLDDGVTWLNMRQNIRVLLAIQALALKKIWP